MNLKMTQSMKALISLLLMMMMVLSMVACDNDPTPAPSGSGGDIASPTDPDGDDNSDGSESSEDPGTNPDGTPKRTEKQIFDDMAKGTVTHYELNDDTVGWICIPGTSIDEVVVQAPDNEFYLRRNNLGNNAFDGCYYADFRTALGARSALSKNVVVYGHSMDDNPDGARFSQLKRYLEVDFAKENPYIYFTATGSDNMLWQIFAVFYTDISFEYHHPNPSNADFLNIITEARKRSELNFDIDVGVNDTILTLSTCTYQFNPANRSNYRFVVMAKLLPAGTQATTPVKVEANPSPKQPA